MFKPPRDMLTVTRFYVYHIPMKTPNFRNRQFASFMPFDDRLIHAAETAVNESLRVQESERVLIVCNPEHDSAEISMSLHDAVLRRGGIPVMIFQQRKDQLDFADEAVTSAVATVPEVIISISSEKMGKDRKAISNPYQLNGKSYDNTFHYLMASRQCRSFWSPGITRRIFMETVPVDYGRMKQEAKAVKKILDLSEEIRIFTEKGTDLLMGVKGRKAFTDDGDFSTPGSGGNLPAGESFISPELGNSKGTIVFDGSISTHDGVLVLKNPVKVGVENGFVTSIEGGDEAGALLNTIELGEENSMRFEREGKLPATRGSIYKKNARNLGELGIGLNPAARITGNMLEDEKVYGTCHIAIGSNYDEDAQALIHLDCLIIKPTITARTAGGREILLMDKGKLIL